MDGKVGEVRNSQLISTFGPGAIMDLPDFSILIAGIDEWNLKQCTPINEPRLTRKLGVKKIYSPPHGDEKLFGARPGTLPAYRFPRYLVCPKCRKLSLAKNFYKKDQENISYCLCDRENGLTKVFPARFIVACSAGHIDDFPWDFYVHKGKKTDQCKDRLYLNDKGATGSISDVEVECKGCETRRSLDEAFNEQGLGKCLGHRQWLGPGDTQPCNEKPRALLRGASNLYFPVVVSALSIPPFTNPLHQDVADVMDRLSKIDSKEKLQVFIEGGVLTEFEGKNIDDVWNAIQRQRSLGEGANQDLYFPEWEALLNGVAMDAGLDFETEEEDVPHRYADKISNLIMVRRLTEVRALDGFSRIEAIPDNIDSADNETAKSSYKASLSKQEYINWRPGIITKGEGIFITLKEESLNEWEERFRDKPFPMAEAFKQYCEDRKVGYPGGPEPRYVLLHTLSHALMRQLCMDSGYSATSLRERIYSRNTESEKMAGILIYTATADSEGSLGGLVELGKAERFEEVLWNALQEARFCSGDPLCSEHKPDDVGDLNGAACHACQLSAETSCEKSNHFLDRSFIVPTVSESNNSFFE
ncbi:MULTISPECIES: DUF1998 domain-containing protein [Paenibacillus]|nr:DUF1998 domain-containing protein [Paenibacillus odorifer]MEC0222929.1 DUF1998 domain-containing protein [Paenibacillus odorifer]